MHSTNTGCTVQRTKLCRSEPQAQRFTAILCSISRSSFYAIATLSWLTSQRQSFVANCAGPDRELRGP
ncbi:hypothetical protein EVAR_46598_1 [Eumeta japonica]|uniref:Uncharacterized protein n=1 Tax=Eumeta variegata TaxID=151549 RepID=A0A4C1WPX7_EUMVA|nr:hypothetical protein EVAR_46598_1 [Eumeta japonica]